MPQNGICLAGCGIIGRAHAEAYRELGVAHRLWALDTDRAAAERLCQDFSAADTPPGLWFLAGGTEGAF